MNKINDFEKIEVNSVDIPEPKEAGAFVVKITDVTDKPEYQSLLIKFDIIEGEFKGVYSKLVSSGRTDHSTTWRSYKEGGSQVFFKKFINAIESSNPNYKWNWDEKTLVGKVIVALYGKEQYVKDDPDNKKVEIKTVCRCQTWCSLPDYRAGKFKLPNDRQLSANQQQKYDLLVEKYSSKPVTEKKEEELPPAPEEDLPF